MRNYVFTDDTDTNSSFTAMIVLDFHGAYLFKYAWPNLPALIKVNLAVHYCNFQ